MSFSEIILAEASNDTVVTGEEVIIPSIGNVNNLEEFSKTLEHGTQQQSFTPLFILGGLFLLMYFFTIRPQIKQQKRHKAMVSGLKRGDKIVTSGGIVGTIVKVEDNDQYIQAEIAQNVKVRMLKSTVLQLLAEEEKVVESEK